MITVVARYRVSEGSEDLVATVLAKHVAATRLEPGCLRFIAYRSRTSPRQFLLYEQYTDEEALASHRETPHFREYIEGTVVPVLDERVFDFYDEVGEP
ncbi:MAG TPA: putative quinol monooxygenase [Streptosporangiaceae bacterium]|jgi:quinol monooxygenase YgiN|nr:putative quinol monooxygenase [Streptosporangiaceae bacterium]